MSTINTTQQSSNKRNVAGYTSTLLETPTAIITKGSIKNDNNNDSNIKNENSNDSNIDNSNSNSNKSEQSLTTEQQKYTLSNEQLLQCRTGFTELVSVKQFRAVYLYTIKSIENLFTYIDQQNIIPNNYDYNKFDIHNELHVETPQVVISNAVDKELQRILQLEKEYKHKHELMKKELQEEEKRQQNIILQQQQQEQQQNTHNITDNIDEHKEQQNDQTSNMEQQHDNTVQQDNNNNTDNNDIQQDHTQQQHIDTTEHKQQSSDEQLQQHDQQVNNNTNTTTNSTKTKKSKTKRQKTKHNDINNEATTNDTDDDEAYDFTEDPDFGLHIPLSHAMDDALMPLMQYKQRSTARTKTKKYDSNTITRQLIDNQVHNTIKHTKQQYNNIDPYIQVSDNEVLLHVDIYSNIEPGVKVNEFIVLGSQSLCTLRDKIYCLNNDNRYNIDMNNNHNNNITELSHCYSSYFFIENNFYDDLRDNRAIRLSDNIIQWQNNDDKQLNNTHIQYYKQYSMSDTLFADLSIRLGSHYLYVHSGNCEHTIIFTQIRMYSQLYDINYVLAYPIKIKQHKFNRQICNICNYCVANYIVYNDLLLTYNPAYLCTLCHQNLHYDKDGNQLYTDYQIYPYSHS